MSQITDEYQVDHRSENGANIWLQLRTISHFVYFQYLCRCPFLCRCLVLCRCHRNDRSSGLCPRRTVHRWAMTPFSSLFKYSPSDHVSIWFPSDILSLHLSIPNFPRSVLVVRYLVLHLLWVHHQNAGLSRIQGFQHMVRWQETQVRDR